MMLHEVKDNSKIITAFKFLKSSIFSFSFETNFCHDFFVTIAFTFFQISSWQFLKITKIYGM